MLLSALGTAAGGRKGSSAPEQFSANIILKFRVGNLLARNELPQARCAPRNLRAR